MPRFLIVIFVLGLGGCSSLSYYAQSARGQLAVMAASRPVEDVLADPRTAEPVRVRLRQLAELRRFAVEELRLPETDSYRRYAKLQRDAMAWSVVATPVDSLVPREWCYPVIGCATYRGYFSPEAAQAYAAELALEGWDTAVEPVPAFSTLGWFSDPLPSTVIGWATVDIAGLLFHELAHEALYLRGDSAFNEAYATVVEKEGVRRWLQRYGDAQAHAERKLQARRWTDFLRLLAGARQRLVQLYATGADREELLARKDEILQALRGDYAGLKASWGGYAGYDRWFDRPLNNAHLASINTYHALEPAFRRMLEQVNGDMGAFHATCRELAAMQAVRRRAYIDSLLLDTAGDG